MAATSELHAHGVQLELQVAEFKELAVSGVRVSEDVKNFNEPDFKKNMILFAIMGSGANWVLPTVLLQEIPWFQDHQPEGLCISTYMNAANNFAIVGTMVYLSINHYYYKVPYAISIPVILCMSCAASIFVSFTYDIVVNNTSVFIYITNFVAGLVGSLSSVVMNPFMTQFENSYISAARSGGSTLMLFCALLSIIQNPGGSTTFSPRIFILVFAFIFVFPYFAYKKIVKEQIGIRPKMSSQANSNSDASQEVPLSDAETLKLLPDQADQTNLCDMATWRWNVVTPNSWLRRCAPHMATAAWINFHTWGMLSAVTPFAMEHASLGDRGSSNLALAYQLAAFSMVCGDLSTTLFEIHRFFGLSIFTVCTCVIYLAASGVSGFSTQSSAPCLIALFTCARFVEAHLITSTYRRIATEFQPHEREAASKWVGFTEQICTTMGVVTSVVLVSQYASC